MLDTKAESSKKSNLLPDKKCPGPSTHQAILKNKTDILTMMLVLGSRSFIKRFRPNVLSSPPQASEVRLGLGSGLGARPDK